MSNLTAEATRLREEIPNTETLLAIAECEEMERHPEKYKHYSTFREFMEEADNEA